MRTVWIDPQALLVWWLFPKRGNRNRRVGESQLANNKEQVDTILSTQSDKLNKQGHDNSADIITNSTEGETFRQTVGVSELVTNQAPEVEVLETVEPRVDRVDTPVIAACVPLVETSSLVKTPEVSAKLADSSPATYAQILSGNHFAILNDKHDGLNCIVEDGIVEDKDEISIPSTKEVWNTVQKAQQQMERDLKLIRDPPVEEVENDEQGLTDFIQAKSRSLKKISNTNKSLRRKVVFSARKQTHSYALRGANH